MPTMPTVTGVSWQQATATLIQAGIVPDNGSVPGQFTNLGYLDTWSVAISWVKTSAAAPGIVTAQSPAPGGNVAFDAAINLTVSSHPIAVADMFSAGGYS